MSIIKLSGDAEKSSGLFVFPIRATPVGIFFTNKNQTKLTCNFAKNELSASIVGNPTVQTTHSVLNNQSYIQTDIAETSNLTMFAIYKQPSSFSSKGAMICSTYGTGRDSFGAGLFVNTSGVTFIATQMSTSNAMTAGGRIVAANGWTLAVGRVNGNNNYVKNLTNNLSSNSNYSSRVLSATPSNFRIGAEYGSAYNDSIDVMAVVIFDAALSDNDIEVVAGVLRAYASKHGIKV